MARTTWIIPIFALALFFAGCSPKYVVGGVQRGHMNSTSAVFENTNLPGSAVVYRIIVDDPHGAYSTVVVKPGERSTPVRIPLGRVYIAVEVYRGASYDRTREEQILVTPADEGKSQLFTIHE